MQLELVYRGHREWKDLGRWAKLYGSSLPDYYGKADLYCNMWHRMGVLASAERVLVVGDVVPDLAQCLAQKNAAKLQEVRHLTTRRLPKKTSSRVLQCESLETALPQQFPTGDWDLVIDNGALDAAVCCESLSAEAVRAYIDKLNTSARQQALLVTVGHEAITKEIIKLARTYPHDISISPIRIPFNEKRASVPVVIGFNKQIARPQQMRDTEVQVESNLEENKQVQNATADEEADKAAGDEAKEATEVVEVTEEDAKKQQAQAKAQAALEKRTAAFKHARETMEKFGQLRLQFKGFVKTADDMPRFVCALRLAKLIKEWRHYYYFNSVVPVAHPGVLRQFDIVDIFTGETAYTLGMYDRVVAKNDTKAKTYKACVAIMVPLADEHHWLYRTPSGNQRLAEKAGALRVICVFMPSFTPLYTKEGISPAEVVEKIRKDVGTHLLALNPDKSSPVLLMTQQERFEDERSEVMKLQTESGAMMVYDVVVDEQDEEFKENPEAEGADTNEMRPSEYTRRTLIFEWNPRVAQTEVWFKGDKGQPAFEYDHICHSYHLPIVAHVVERLKTSDTLEGAILGLGGGLMPSLFGLLFGDSVKIDCVEIDPNVVKIATECFGFKADGPRKVVVKDAIEYINDDVEPHSKDFIVVDINGSVETTLLGMEDVTGPHRDFLAVDFMKKLDESVARENGAVLFNSVCQTSQARRQLGQYFRKVFDNVTSIGFGDELNVIFVCSNAEQAMDKANYSNLRQIFLSAVNSRFIYLQAKKTPGLRSMVEHTPLYLGEKSKLRANVVNF